jgi:DNA-damage-inducible protein J
MMTTVQARIDTKVKKDTKRILDKLGLDFSSAINLYFRQITQKKGIPFRVLTENGYTEEEERGILREVEDIRTGKKQALTFDSVDDMMRYVENM